MSGAPRPQQWSIMIEKGDLIRPFLFQELLAMEKLNFYTVDLAYVDLLKDAETKQRGFTRVPNMDYGDKRKPKFLCGIVLKVGDLNYYVPVTSYKQQKPDNFLILAADGQVTSSLRFNYMFPVPKELLQERKITAEPDRAYRSLLAQELLFCRKNQEAILRNLFYTPAFRMTRSLCDVQKGIDYMIENLVLISNKEQINGYPFSEYSNS